MTDWNLVIQADISMLWIQECLKPENSQKTVEELLNEYTKNNENINLINPGLLIMSAYILFVYPKESDTSNFDYSTIDTSGFDIKVGEKRDNNSICRRIRNSLSHANFNIDKYNMITFKDSNTNNKCNNDPFETCIKCEDFGEFVNEIMLKYKDNYFCKHRK